MLENARAMAALPATDLGRARAFYRDTFGLEPVQSLGPEGGDLRYDVDGSGFVVFKSSGSAAGTHTQMSLHVDDVDEVAAEMRDRGVIFEIYDGLDQTDGIATMGDERGGWFKDSEGNLIGLVQVL